MNTVSQPIALRMREAGWKGKTEKVHTKCGLVMKSFAIAYSLEWLPAPNISEIRERLTYEDMYRFWFEMVRTRTAIDKRNQEDFSHWLYTVTASAVALAEVWLWTTSSKKGE